LRQTAREFQALHWSRLAFNAASAAFAFVGFVAFDRQRILAQPLRQAARRDSQPVPHDVSATALG
jgi:hypothetical protein